MMKSKYSKITALSLTAMMLVACGEGDETQPELDENSFPVEDVTENNGWDNTDEGGEVFNPDVSNVDDMEDETNNDWGVTDENVEEVIEEKGIEEAGEFDAWYVYKDKEGKEVKKSKYSMIAQKEFERIKQLVLKRDEKNESLQAMAKSEAERLLSEQRAKEEQAKKDLEDMQKEMDDYMTGGHVLNPPFTDEELEQGQLVRGEEKEVKEPLKLDLPTLFKFEFPTLAKTDKKIDGNDFNVVNLMHTKQDLMYHFANLRNNLIIRDSTQQLDVPTILEEALNESPEMLLIDGITFNKVEELNETVYYINVQYTLTQDEYAELQAFAEDFVKENAHLSAVEKVKLLNKTISNLGDYSTDLSNPNIFSPYTLYNDNEGVCQAYTALAQFFFAEMGIENRVITGTLDGVPHVWNEIFIDDEVKQIDFTLNDIMGNEDYLLKTPEAMKRTHVIDEK